MPNMSRRTIHSVSSSSDDSQTFTSYEHKQTNTDSYVTTRNIADSYANYRPRQLFNNNYESTYSKSSHSQSTAITTWWSRTRTKVVTTVSRMVTTVLTALYFGFRVQTSWFTKLHKLTSKVMLLDTWLLWKTNAGNRTKQLTALCLIPLLLLGGWWLWSNLGNSLFARETSQDTSEKVTYIPEVKKEELLQQESIKMVPIIPTVDYVVKNLEEHEVFINQQKIIDDLREEITKLRSDMLESEQTRREDIERVLLGLDNTGKTTFITQRINRCCKNPFIDIESYINKILINLLNNPEFLRNQRGFNDYLRTIFIARQDLEYRLGNITATFDTKYADLLTENSLKLMDEVTSRIQLAFNREAKSVDSTLGGEITLSDQRIKKIVRSVLAVYDADKTGLVDYAMESMGAQIMSTRCTENYHYGKAVVSVLGIPLWYPVNSPRTLITPGISPGQCWAFQNFPGFVMIRLAKRIKIEAFSIEHINRLLVPNGDIDSAPKQFEIYGLTDENDKDPVLLGEYVYDYDGEPLQFFDVQKDGQVFEIIELRVISNHGNPNYTCLYRFRVHGKSVS